MSMYPTPIIFSITGSNRIPPEPNPQQSFLQGITSRLRSNDQLPINLEVLPFNYNANGILGLTTIKLPLEGTIEDDEVQRLDELINISVLNIGNLHRYAIVPSSTKLGFDPMHIGDELAKQKSEALKAIAEVLFNFTNSAVAVTSVTTEAGPNSIEGAIRYLPQSEFSIIQRRLVPNFSDHTDEMYTSGGLVEDRGNYFTLSSAPFPFGISTHPDIFISGEVNPLVDFRTAVDSALRAIGIQNLQVS